MLVPVYPTLESVTKCIFRAAVWTRVGAISFIPLIVTSVSLWVALALYSWEEKAQVNR